MRRASRCCIALAPLLMAALFLCMSPQPGFAQNLNGVSCDDVMTSGVQGAQSSPLGTTSAASGFQSLPMRSGFDYLESWVWVNSADANCANALNNFYICVETAGRFGDADGDGAPASSGGLCSNHPFLAAFPSGADGLDPTNDALLAATESYGILIDRNCDGAYDLQLSIRGGVADPQLRVDINFVNGGAVGPPVGTLLGGHGVTYEFTSTIPGNTAFNPCPDPSTFRGHILVNVPNWDQFFAAPGLNAGQFGWGFDNGNNQDQVAEDLVGGNYDDFAPGLTITKNPNLSLCVGDPGTLTVTVTNNSNASVANIGLTDTLPNGWDFVDLLNGGGCVSSANQVGNVITFSPAFDLAPCEECVITFRVAPNGNCEEGDNVAEVSGEASSYCIEPGILTTVGVGPEQDSSHLVCNQPPCVTMTGTAGPDTACVGEDIELSATVENCSLATEDIEVCVAGQCTTFVDVPAGAQRTHTVSTTMQPCETAGQYCFPVSYSAANDCGTDDGDQTQICVYCGVPEVSITKDNGLGVDECVANGSTVTFTLHVENTGPTDLTDITVTDVIDCAYAGYVGGSASPAATTEPADGATGTLEWNLPGPLAPGATLDFTYDVTFTIPDAECPTQVSCPNTADVVAHCADAEATDEATETTCITCEGGEACPHTIGFWRQQCAQKGNGSTKICLEGMYDLWDCVLNTTGVTQWLNNDGSYTATADVFGMSDSDRFAFLCSQLQGPRPMTLHDMTEVQYLGLMLNVCVGALPTSTLIDNGMFTGTVGELIAGIEDVLNNGGNYGYWETQADQTNNRIGVLAADCSEDPFRTVEACVAPASGDLQQSFFDRNVNAVLARAVPNPTRDRDVLIQFRVPSTHDQGSVELSIYTVAGRLVRTLVSDVRSAGDYQTGWDLRSSEGARVPAGIYFYRLRVGNEETTQRLVVTQ